MKCSPTYLLVSNFPLRYVICCWPVNALVLSLLAGQTSNLNKGEIIYSDDDMASEAVPDAEDKPLSSKKHARRLSKMKLFVSHFFFTLGHTWLSPPLYYSFPTSFSHLGTLGYLRPFIIRFPLLFPTWAHLAAVQKKYVTKKEIYSNSTKHCKVAPSNLKKHQVT